MRHMPGTSGSYATATSFRCAATLLARGAGATPAPRRALLGLGGLTNRRAVTTTVCRSARGVDPLPLMAARWLTRRRSPLRRGSSRPRARQSGTAFGGPLERLEESADGSRRSPRVESRRRHRRRRRLAPGRRRGGRRSGGPLFGPGVRALARDPPPHAVRTQARSRRRCCRAWRRTDWRASAMPRSIAYARRPTSSSSPAATRSCGVPARTGWWAAARCTTSAHPHSRSRPPSSCSSASAATPAATR